MTPTVAIIAPGSMGARDAPRGLGGAEDAWLGCDLSRQYVEINADYTT
jgi:hypothetical protein